MLDVKFFRNPRFTAASLGITLMFFAMFGSIFLLTQYFQFVLGYTPLETGVRFLPIAASDDGPVALERAVRRTGSARSWSSAPGC